MKKALIFVVLCFAAVSSFGQNSLRSAYKIRAKGFSLVVTFQGKAHQLATNSEQIDAAKITDTDILFAKRKDGFTYLVVNVSGWSREKQNDRQCGAGIESNLLWIKLDAAWKIAALKSVNYESCWQTIDAGDGYKIDGNSLNIEFDNFRDDVHTKMSYNAEQPEKGFLVEETKLKEN